jgi:hypothetical protein
MTDDKVFENCSVCDTESNVDDLCTTEYDSKVCNDCVQICNRCDSVGTVDDCFHTVDGDYIWCEACTDRRAYWCDSCEEYNSNGTSHIADRGEYWCSGCADYSAYWCEDCDEYNADGCDRCSDDTDGNGQRIIHDYSYRPDAIFHSTKSDERLFFGLEIEVEASESKADSALHAYQLEGADLAYLKNDGSLDHGFEIVTHPMSHDFFKNEADQLWSVLEDLRSKSGMRVKSWDTRTCGLHIHISRTGFNGGAHMHRFLNLVYSNPEFYSALAGRQSDQWAKFTDINVREYERNSEGDRIPDTFNGGYKIVSKRTFAHKLSGNRGSDRYSAVNTNNRETLEMRIFRGTVNGNTIKAQLDLAHASVEYTRNLTVQDVRNGALSADNFMWYIFQNEALYPELVARIDKCIKLDEPVRSTEQLKEVIDTMLAYTVTSRSEGITFSYTTNGSN